MDVSNLFFILRLLLPLPLLLRSLATRYSAIGSFVSFSHGYNYNMLYSHTHSTAHTHTLIGVYWQVNHSKRMVDSLPLAIIVLRYLSDKCAPQKLSRCVAKSKLRTNEVREREKKKNRNKNITFLLSLD